MRNGPDLWDRGYWGLGLRLVDIDLWILLWEISQHCNRKLAMQDMRIVYNRTIDVFVDNKYIYNCKALRSLLLQTNVFPAPAEPQLWGSDKLTWQEPRVEFYIITAILVVKLLTLLDYYWSGGRRGWVGRRRRRWCLRSLYRPEVSQSWQSPAGTSPHLSSSSRTEPSGLIDSEALTSSSWHSAGSFLDIEQFPLI